MSFDELMHEVNEDLRKENLVKFWQKYGNAIITGAALIVGGAALYSGFKTYQKSGREKDALTLSMAEAQIKDGKKTDALLTLDVLIEKGSAQIPSFARFQKAALLAGMGKADEASVVYDHLASDQSLTPGLHASAILSKVSLMIDNKPFADVDAALKPLMADALYAPFAYEMQGLALFKTGKKDEAKKAFDAALKSDTAPSGLRARVAILMKACE